ncbi:MULTISPECIES: PepSY domain-containing protein [unclassified Mycolicibacterium]|uniref:PepSY-associated TM helix domain-containing protein n=1 Tax=unclassified Mycolicibacterium TaxID=2636767 RepID=UPI0012DCFDEB|nr:MULTISPECIES: PepSY domain-containing protein [unclassified Mycolicibacterium]MUL83092.1 PepSY domain-containing protein [Mycolicibacterium sp. CBMA 329]MUL89427.1 PepSY domain-containing protein [Mycolicibacterium sp. CBMA 331]MUL99116.1 PepSY domain-containing protein [Mycolicibacterium sp. CBMA 334]MUM24742.1 PepSY domain-containing protein [Mycolicibacterium sp. CBMA 295]MUM38943.1 PepSY domain-containing protein [Mycolicibacterium sp. CBMA 247]
MTITPDDQLREESPPPVRPGSIRPLLVRLHFYAGVFVGPFILIAAVTGLLYALIPQIDAFVYRHELTVEHVGAVRLPLADQLAAARLEHPEGTVESIRPPVEPDETTQIRLVVDPAIKDIPPDYSRTVFVDPYTGEVRGALTTYGQWMPVRAWFDELHRDLHLGAFGRNYSELAASWLWVIALAGLALWIMRHRENRTMRNLVLPDRTASGRRRTLSWHGVVGVWIVVVLLALSVSGITWSRYAGETVNGIQARLNTTAPAVDTSLPVAAAELSGTAVAHHGNHGGPSDLRGADTVLQSAEQAGLRGPMWMYPPSESGQAWKVAERKRDWPTRFDEIAVDPDSGAVTDRVNFAQWPVLAKLTEWTIEAHMGLLFGIANQIVLALTAIGLITVIVRGYRMWWQRRPTRGSDWAVGRPPLRGTIHRLPPLGSAALVVVTAVVGWCLPLFGLSLLAFLIVDAVVAMRKGKSNV